MDAFRGMKTRQFKILVMVIGVRTKNSLFIADIKLISSYMYLSIGASWLWEGSQVKTLDYDYVLTPPAYKKT